MVHSCVIQYLMAQPFCFYSCKCQMLKEIVRTGMTLLYESWISTLVPVLYQFPFGNSYFKGSFILVFTLFFLHLSRLRWSWMCFDGELDHRVFTTFNVFYIISYVLLTVLELCTIALWITDFDMIGLAGGELICYEYRSLVFGLSLLSSTPCRKTGCSWWTR